MKYYVQDFNGVLQDIIPLIETVPLSDSEIVLLWQDITDPKTVKDIMMSGREVIIMQHGRHATTDYCPPMSKPLTADKILVWGVNDVKRLQSVGITRYIHTGTTIFSHLIGRRKHDGINIVFCPAHYYTESMENIDIVRELRKTGHHIVSKIVAGHMSNLYDNPIYSNSNAPDHLDICANVLSVADIVVGVEDGTFELMAMALDIPVIGVKHIKPFVFGGKKIETPTDENYSKGVHTTTIEDLNKTIEYVLSHQEELKEERKQTAIDDGGYGMDAVTNILKAINYE